MRRISNVARANPLLAAAKMKLRYNSQLKLFHALGQTSTKFLFFIPRRTPPLCKQSGAAQRLLCRAWLGDNAIPPRQMLMPQLCTTFGSTAIRRSYTRDLPESRERTLALIYSYDLGSLTSGRFHAQQAIDYGTTRTSAVDHGRPKLICFTQEPKSWEVPTLGRLGRHI